MTDHAGEARRILGLVGDSIRDAVAAGDMPMELMAAFNSNLSRDIRAAQVHATLALTREQRTGNLIGFLAVLDARGTTPALRDRIEGMIQQELGL